MKNHFMKPISQLLLLACMLAPTGCATTGLFDFNQQAKFETADAENPVIRAMCLWQPAEGTGLDNVPTRGFAGQIYFFTQNNDQPVALDGDIRIYLFDDSGTEDEQVKPIHQFDFLDGSFGNFLYETQLGPAYRLFVPYTKKGYHHTNCALRVRMIPKSGPTIYSDLVKVTLPGVKDEKLDKLASAVKASVQKQSDETLTKNVPTKITPIAANQKTMDQKIERVEQLLQHLLEENQQSTSPQYLETPAAARKLPQSLQQADTPSDADIEIKRFRLSNSTTAAEESQPVVNQPHPLSSLDSMQETEKQQSISETHPIADIF